MLQLRIFVVQWSMLCSWCLRVGKLLFFWCFKWYYVLFVIYCIWADHLNFFNLWLIRCRLNVSNYCGAFVICTFALIQFINRLARFMCIFFVIFVNQRISLLCMSIFVLILLYITKSVYASLTSSVERNVTFLNTITNTIITIIIYSVIANLCSIHVILCITSSPSFLLNICKKSTWWGSRDKCLCNLMQIFYMLLTTSHLITITFFMHRLIAIIFLL